MIQIKFPDGATRSYESGVTPFKIASSISEGLARNVLSAVVNEEVWDSNRPITESSEVKLLTWNDEKGKETLWHSSAHLMAEAIQHFYPETKFAIGPPIENGFYYDIDLGGKTISDSDFKKLEDKMLELARQKNNFIRKDVSKEEAIAYFTEKGDEYKLELLEDLKNEAVKTNAEWAKKIGINQSVAVTCVKPSGTVSQLTDSASGIHAVSYTHLTLPTKA